MAATLNPYLSFAGTARDALQFYQSVFGGELVLNTFGQYGAEGEGADGIMHGQLTTPGGFTIMGADTPPGQEHRPGNTMSVSLSGDDGPALRGYWSALSDGAAVAIPLEKQMWGDEFGMCTDRFGTPWMVNITRGDG